MKAIKRILFTIATLLLVLLFLFNFYTFFCVKILKQDLATVNGYALLEVVSGSMEPTIHIGDMIVIDTKNTNYQENDIVTFYDVNGSFVTHRILSINGEEMITKGDNNNTQDEVMPISNIVGKYVFAIGGLGKIFASFKTPFVMIMILIIGFMVCFLISTDKDGKPILTEEEKEFQEFIKNKEKKKNEEKADVAVKTSAEKKEEKSNKVSKEKVVPKKTSKENLKDSKKTTKKVQEVKSNSRVVKSVPNKKQNMNTNKNNTMSNKKRKKKKKKSR